MIKAIISKEKLRKLITSGDVRTENWHAICFDISANSERVIEYESNGKTYNTLGEAIVGEEQ